MQAGELHSHRSAPSAATPGDRRIHRSDTQISEALQEVPC
jgi:hypothetical protein